MQSDFGSTLRHARMRKGIDLNTAARRLRIRPDVLESIEDGDFNRMPPRGYARNMINSYAHLLGLNATEITSQYLDEQYAYEVDSARRPARGTGFDMTGADRRHSGSRSRQHQDAADDFDIHEERHRTAPQAARNASSLRSHRAGDGASNRFGRREYTEDFDDPHPMTERTYNRNAAHRTRGKALDDRMYLNAYSGPARFNGGGLRERLPLILVIAVVAVLVIVVLVLLFGPKSSSSSKVANMPVNATSTTSSTSVTAAAPTSFTFTYTVEKGYSSWIEVYIDDQVQVAETVEGPATKTFTCSSSLEFICSGIDGVKATQDGTQLTLSPDDSGVVDMNITFADVLAQWQKDHGVASSSTTSAAMTSTTATTSSSTSTTSV